MLEANIELKFNNSYYFKVIDTKTNSIKKEIKIHNIVLDNYWDKAMGSSFFGELIVGSGTKEPLVTDIKLEKPWPRYNSPSKNDPCRYTPKKKEYIKENNKDYLLLEFEIPPTQNHAGTITEVGLTTKDGSILVTRALLKDESGAISPIIKTEFDKVIIEVKINLTIKSNSKNFILEPSEHNHMLIFNSSPVSHGGKGVLNFGKIEGGSFRSPTTGESYDVPGCGGIFFLLRDTLEDGAAPLDNFLLETFTKNEYDSSQRTRIIEGVVKSETPHYFWGAGIRGVGKWIFPNYDICPILNLTDIPVATCDYYQKEYKCPLNYFIKDTDKVYKNGVLLTRDVDYTIDNENNQDGLLELSLGNLAKITGGIEKKGIGGYIELFKPVTEKSINNGHYVRNNVIYGFSNVHPLFFTCKEPLKCNTLRLASRFPSYRHYILSYSEDGESYKVCYDLYSTPENKITFCHFDTVIAKYWKLETDADRSISIYRSDKIYPFIGYVGRGIILKDDPLKGDILTMDAQIDRPYVDNETILKYSLKIKF